MAAQAAFTTVDLLAKHYKNKSLEIRVHWFPLPFHHNAYFVAQASQGQRVPDFVPTSSSTTLHCGAVL